MAWGRPPCVSSWRGEALPDPPPPRPTAEAQRANKPTAATSGTVTSAPPPPGAAARCLPGNGVFAGPHRRGGAAAADYTYHNASRGRTGCFPVPGCDDGALGSVVCGRRRAWRREAGRAAPRTTTPVGPCAAAGARGSAVRCVRGGRPSRYGSPVLWVRVQVLCLQERGKSG